MRRSWMLGAVLGGVIVAGVAGVFTWWDHASAPPPVSAEQRLDDIPEEEYEKWMQDLGYTQ
jgi:hypothetical protein